MQRTLFHYDLGPASSMLLKGIVPALTMALAITACDIADDEMEGDFADEIEEAEPRIYGGVETNDTDLRAVVQLSTKFTTTTSRKCTGTLVTEDVVVTAAHCFCKTDDASDCFSTTRVKFFDLPTFPPDFSTDATVIVHPGFSVVAGTPQDDIAVVLLDMNNFAMEAVSNVIPIEVAMDEPSVGETLEVVGYGLSDAACEDLDTLGTQRTTDLDVTHVYADTFLMSSPGTGICGGDSGGPVLNDQHRITGVHSAGEANYSRHMEIDYQRDFIQQHACDYDHVSVSMWNTCANSLCPCEESEGDCDSDSECVDGLLCSHNVGSEYGLASAVDICEQLPAPTLNVEFVGCQFGSPRFLVDWGHTGLNPETFDIDVKMGFGNYQSHHDGSNGGSNIYWGSSNRNDSFRHRVCRGGNCSDFTNASTGSWNCGGGGGGGGEPL